MPGIFELVGEDHNDNDNDDDDEDISDHPFCVLFSDSLAAIYSSIILSKREIQQERRVYKKHLCHLHTDQRCVGIADTPLRPNPANSHTYIHMHAYSERSHATRTIIYSGCIVGDGECGSFSSCVKDIARLA